MSENPQQTTEQEKDIVDHLSDATGFFHDDDAARLRDIAEASGQKPVGVVRAGVEREIERREWRCVYFDEDEEREYISSNAYEYYRIHRSYQLEYERAIEALPHEQNAHLREVPVYEHAAELLKDEARRHEAKADKAEQWLRENGHELPAVEAPTGEMVQA
jgi:hypothetical protein